MSADKTLHNFGATDEKDLHVHVFLDKILT